MQTSYLVAEVVMLPLSGFLSRALSTKWLFVMSSMGFTFASFLCSTADSIDQMIVWTTEFTSRVAGDEMDPNKGVGKLLEFLMKDVEKGRTLPDGWDFGLSEELQDHPIVKELKEKNQVARWTYSKARAWFEEHGVRRFGFHGISHRYVSGRAAGLLGRDVRDLHLVTVHLGNGCSACAVREVPYRQPAGGKPALGLGVSMQDGANIITLGEDLKRAMAAITARAWSAANVSGSAPSGARKYGSISMG